MELCFETSCQDHTYQGRQLATRVVMKLFQCSKMAESNKKIFETAFGNLPIKLLKIPAKILSQRYSKTNFPVHLATRFSRSHLSLLCKAAQLRKSSYTKQLECDCPPIRSSSSAITLQCKLAQSRFRSYAKQIHCGHHSEAPLPKVVYDRSWSSSPSHNE